MKHSKIHLVCKNSLNRFLKPENQILLRCFSQRTAHIHNSNCIQIIVQPPLVAPVENHILITRGVIHACLKRLQLSQFSILLAKQYVILHEKIRYSPATDQNSTFRVYGLQCSQYEQAINTYHRSFSHQIYSKHLIHEITYPPTASSDLPNKSNGSRFFS